MTSDSLFELVEVIESGKYQKLCPNRIWNVSQAWEAQRKAGDRGSGLIDLLKRWGRKFEDALTHEDHSACTFDFCEFSSRNFTAVKQYHEPNRNEDNDRTKVTNNHENGKTCFPLEELFSDSLLCMAVQAKKLTAWKLDGSEILEHPRPFLAISHVWSDGTGAGTWPSKQGIWWDTVCVPQDRKARSQALDTMAWNYEFAKLTVVHDRFLRNLNFESPEQALFGIVMSPWFTRGWTALELAKSRIVKVIFKDSIQDLDKDILDRVKNNDMTRLVKVLRSNQVLDIKDLLLVLKHRYTSWLKDRAAIAGLLTGVEIPNSEKDTFQRDTYQKILVKVERICHSHLFHKSITMEGEFGWCATSLFKLPQARENPLLRVALYGSVTGRWRVFSIRKSSCPVSDDIYGVRVDLWGANGNKDKNRSLLCGFGNSHGLVEAKLQNALQSLGEDYLVLFKPDSMDKADSESEMHSVSIGQAGSHSQASSLTAPDPPSCHYSPDITCRPDFIKPSGSIDRLQSMCQADSIAKPDFTDCPELIDQPESSGRARDEKNAVLVKVFTTSDQKKLRCKFVGSLEFVSKPMLAEDDLQPILTIGATNKGWFPLERSAWEAFRLEAEKNKDACAPDNKKGLETEKEKMQKPTKAVLQLGWSRLHTEAFRRKVCDQDVLLADLDRRDCLGQLPLHIAAQTRTQEGTQEGTQTRTQTSTCDRFLLSWMPKLETVDCLDLNGQVPLHHAALSGSIGNMDLLLRRGARADIRDRNGATALHLAAETGFPDVVKYLCDHDGMGCDSGGLTKDGLTPLHYAALRGHAEVANTILNHAASIDIETRTMWWTPLHYAADNGHASVVELLLRRGADVHAKDRLGWTPLHFAALGGYQDVAKELLRRRADINMEDKNGWTPLRFAALNGHRALVELLASARAATRGSLPSWEPEAARNHHAVVNWVKGNQANFGRTLCHWLYFAALDGRTAVTELAMNQAWLQLDDNDCVRRETSVAHAAAGYGFIGTLNFFAEAEISMLAIDGNGLTPLHFACENGRAATVQWLLSKGGKLDEQDKCENRSPLHFAARKGHLTVVQLLVKKNANVEVLDKDGRTPLHLAAEGGHTRIVDFLIVKGASFDVKDKLGHTPLHLAARFGHEALVKLLIRREAKQTTKDNRGCTALWFAAMYRHEKIMELLSTDRHADAQDSAGRTPLHCAAQGGQKPLLQWLVDKGYGIKAQSGPKIENLTLIGVTDIGDQTPLHYAASSGGSEVLKWLVENQANVLAVDAEGRTALHCAAEHGKKEMVDLLLKGVKDSSENDASMAFLNAGDKEGRTPLHYAAQNGHEEFVKTLLDKEEDLWNSRRPQKQLLDKKTCLLNTADHSGSKPLHFAALGGNDGVVKQLCLKLKSSRGDLEATDAMDRTALHLAAENGKQLAVERLLASDAKFDAQDKNGWTPLHYAANTAWECSKSIMQRILECDAIVNKTKDNSGCIPLHYAALKGHEPSVRCLLEAVHDEEKYQDFVDTRDNLRRTPLHCAARNGNKDVVQCLLDKKACVLKQDQSGRTPLHYAARGGHRAAVKSLVACNAAAVHTVENDGRSPLHFAAMSNYIDCVKWLLSKGARIDQKSLSQQTSLHWAAERGRVAMISLLLDNRASITEVDENGRMALHYAAQNGHDDVVKVLIEKGANFEARCKRQLAPMHYAAEHGHTTVVQYLKDNNAEIEAEDLDGQTPLCQAAQSGSRAVVELLLDLGADVGRKDSWHRRNTPLHCAARRGDTKIVALLLNMRAKIDAINAKSQTPLHYACMRGHVDVVNQLIINEDTVGARDDDQQTPLHYAAEGGFLDIVQSLLCRDLCDKCIDTKNGLGRTPLHCAAMSGKLAVAEWLLDTRAKIEAKDKEEDRPIHLAAQKGHKRIVELLDFGGADIQAANREGATPLHRAAQGGDEETIRWLKEKLGQKLDLRLGDKEDCTPLHYAAQNDHPEAMKLLKRDEVERDDDDRDDEDLRVKSKDGKTPLHCAAGRGCENALEWLLKKTKSKYIQEPDNEARTPLHLAAMSGKPKVVEILIREHTAYNLDMGRALASQDKEKQIPLDLAITDGNEDVIEAFLRELQANQFVQAVVASDRISVRVAAMDAIREQVYAFDGALEPLNKILTVETDERVLHACLTALSGASELPEGVLKGIANCLNHNSGEIQKLAISVLELQKQINIDEPFMGLAEKLQSQRQEIKEAAIGALQKRLKLPEEVIFKLGNLLLHSQYLVQEAAAKALKKYPRLPSHVIASLVHCICDTKTPNEARIAAAETFRGMSYFPPHIERRLVDLIRNTARQAVAKLGVVSESPKHSPSIRLAIRTSMFKIMEPTMEDTKSNEVAQVAEQTFRGPFQGQRAKGYWSRMHSADQRMAVLRALRKPGLNAVTVRNLLDVPDTDSNEARRAVLEVLREQECLDPGLRGVETIVKDLGDRDPRVRDLAAAIFQKQEKLSDETLLSIKAFLKGLGPSNDESPRTPVLNAFQGPLSCSDETFLSMKAFLKGLDPGIDESIRTSVLKALQGRLSCSDETLSQIQVSLNSGDEEAKIAAIESLNNASPLSSGAHSAILSRLKDKSCGVRLAAIRAYDGYAADKEPPSYAIQVIGSCLNDEERVVRKEAACALQRWGYIANIVTRLIDSLAKKDPSDQVVTIQLLQDLKPDKSLDKKIIPALAKHFEDSNPDVQWAAIEAVWRHPELPEDDWISFATRLKKIFDDFKNPLRFDMEEIPPFFKRGDLPESLLQALIRRLFKDADLHPSSRASLMRILHSQQAPNRILYSQIRPYLEASEDTQRMCAIDIFRTWLKREKNSEFSKEAEVHLRASVWKQVVRTFRSSALRIEEQSREEEEFQSQLRAKLSRSA